MAALPASEASRSEDLELPEVLEVGVHTPTVSPRRLRFPPALYLIQLSMCGFAWSPLLSADSSTPVGLALLLLVPVPLLIAGQMAYFQARLSGEAFEAHGEVGRRVFGTPGGYTVIVTFSTLAIVVADFAHAYYVLALHSRDCFGSALTKIDAVYFTMTTMSTVGYGNVAPESQLCRLVASWQMLFTMVFVAVFFGLLVAVLSSQLKRPE